MKYTANHKLADIITDHYQLLLVMSRFGLPMGFGDKNVRTVCNEHGVDVDTFLAVVNYVSNGDTGDITSVSVAEMVSFLRKSHTYYLNFFYPQLRQKLVVAVEGSDEKLSQLILSFFDSYVDSVREHLIYENEVVFSYVGGLCQGKIEDNNFRISRYTRKHEKIDSMLMELKRIIIKYYPDNGKSNELNAVLYDIFSCEADLKSHCDIEDNVFVPSVLELEAKVRGEK